MSGVFAFLITDLVASTRSWQADSVKMAALLERHDAILFSAIAAFDGTVFKHTGDGVCAVFADPAGATAAAVDAQGAFTSDSILVRMGIHLGVAVRRGDDYFGLSVSRCARIAGAAHGGQILVSLAAEEVARDELPAEVSLHSVGRIRLRDLGHDDELFQVLAPGLLTEFPPPRSDARRAATIPFARSALVGRDPELHDLEQLVQAGRLVTVVGPGGCGKTRMAVEVMARTSPRLTVAFADFSATADPTLAPTVVMEALDIAPGGDVAAVTRFLADTDLFLVLDNCEHLVEAVSDLVDEVLSTCPNVSLLATSREPLGVDGELVWRLPPLTGDAAGALFIERAREAGAEIASAPDSLDIAEICARLDGIPLALELAAKQAAHLSLRQVRDLLDDRFRLLVGGSRRALPRQRTLEATIAWSYDLLDDDHRRFLSYLAVFNGSFTVEAAAFVAGQATAALTEAVHRLGALHDKSLVTFDASSGRYRMLETVRAFARQRLTETGSAENADQRFYDWLWSQSPGPWRYPFAAESIDVPDLELDNLRAALETCASAGRHDAASVLAAAYGPMWFVTIRGSEGLGWLRLPPEIDEQLTLDDRLAWRTAATYAAFAAWDVAGIRAIDEHLELVPANHPALCPLLFAKAWTYVHTRPIELHRLVDQVRLAADGDRGWLANCDTIEGLASLLDGRVDEAITLLKSAVEFTEDVGAGNPYINLAVAYHLAGRHNDVTAIVDTLDLEHRPPGGFWSDVTGPFLAVLDAIGRDDRILAGRRLSTLLTTTGRRYPHVQSSYGFGVQAAAAVATATHRFDDAVTLLTASHRFGLDLRYEGATAVGRMCLARCQAEITEDSARAAVQRADALTFDALVALANEIADAAG